MPRTRTLTSHAAIQDWVKFRNGHPAIVNERDKLGNPRRRLNLAFRNNGSLDRPNGTMSPCSWDAWLAELDRQKLALKVIDSDDDDIQPSDISFVDRDSLN